MLTCTGCLSSTSDQEVVVYVALDKEFSEPLLDEFERRTGIRVLAKYDVESNKTVGLANELMQTSTRNRCDVFWNNEILHTLRLERAGRLAAFPTSLADSFPPSFRSPQGSWYGLAARARVLIINTDLISEGETWPDSIFELANPKWKGQCGLAKPLFGTSATHAAVLFAALGHDEAMAFYRSVQSNAIIEGGNKQVALHVASGRYAWGVTDTDDALIELEKGKPVRIVFPDQDVGQLGTLLIPNSIAMVDAPPHRDAAGQLIEFLLGPDIELRLAEGPSGQIPLSSKVTATSRVSPDSFRVMEVDFRRAADAWDASKTVMADLYQ